MIALMVNESAWDETHSNLSGFCRVRLSHRNVGVFGIVRRFLYWRRRRVWELAHVKLHNRRMPGSTPAITWCPRYPAHC